MDVPRLRRALLRWFSRRKRPLPWRKTRDPYATWVAEIMLQQTTVVAVIPFYERFIKRFPTISSLASSTEGDVLTLWSGLGYYSRARNLRLAAHHVILSHQGLFPREVAVAMTLKGVGRYTASAVTSIAYGTRAAAVDGNVRRVISRLHAVRGLTEGKAQELADGLLSPRSPGAWNEALMELGATVCAPRNPSCDRCPVFAFCRGRTRAEHWSEGKPRRPGIRTAIQMALVRRGESILLMRNPEGDLLGGLWELPHSGIPGRKNSAPSLEERYPGVLGIDSAPLATIRHSITHHRIVAHIFKASLAGRTSDHNLSFHRIDVALRLPLSGLTRKALNAAGLAGG